MPARLPLVAVLVVLALGISAAGAQSPGTVARVGTLSSAWGPDHPAIEGMKAGLRAMGFEAGRNVVFDDRYTEGDLSALPAAAAALVGQRVDVIFTTNDAAMRAALAATKTVPIVFSTVSDPVAEGFVHQEASVGARAEQPAGMPPMTAAQASRGSGSTTSTSTREASRHPPGRSCRIGPPGI